MTCRIVLVDDQPLIRECMSLLLAEERDLEVIAEAEDGLALLELLETLPQLPDLVITDVTMPNLDGIEATRRAKLLYPDLKVLILTVHTGEDYAIKALQAGASGVVVKDDATDELVRAIGRIRSGENYISLNCEYRPFSRPEGTVAPGAKKESSGM